MLIHGEPTGASTLPARLGNTVVKYITTSAATHSANDTISTTNSRRRGFSGRAERLAYDSGSGLMELRGHNAGVMWESPAAKMSLVA